MRLDGFALFVDDMANMIRFYRDVLEFEIKEGEDTSNVYLIKDDTLFLLYGRKDFEKMTSCKYALTCASTRRAVFRHCPAWLIARANFRNPLL